jgi:hypothetical protein
MYLERNRASDMDLMHLAHWWAFVYTGMNLGVS